MTEHLPYVDPVAPPELLSVTAARWARADGPNLRSSGKADWGTCSSTVPRVIFCHGGNSCPLLPDTETRKD